MRPHENLSRPRRSRIGNIDVLEILWFFESDGFHGHIVPMVQTNGKGVVILRQRRWRDNQRPQKSVAMPLGVRRRASRSQSPQSRTHRSESFTDGTRFIAASPPVAATLIRYSGTQTDGFWHTVSIGYAVASHRRIVIIPDPTLTSSAARFLSMTSNGDGQRVGVIGLGLMGSAIIDRLLECQYVPFIWNRTPEKADAFPEARGRLERQSHRRL